MSKRLNQKSTILFSLPPEQATYFRNLLRSARAQALSDAEGFQPISFCIEQLGTTLFQKIQDLGKYEEGILWVAKHSSLAHTIPTSLVGRDAHTPFNELYRSVRISRNEALHHGAYARHLTSHAVQLSLILEDGLMNMLSSHTYKVSDFMVRDPITAAQWQPVSLVRQQMLVNSFTYLPILINDAWRLLSDRSIARYLRSDESRRNERLAKTVADAVRDGFVTEEAQVSRSDTPISEIVDSFDGKPILVSKHDDSLIIVGILTAFDLL